MRTSVCSGRKSVRACGRRGLTPCPLAALGAGPSGARDDRAVSGSVRADALGTRASDCSHGVLSGGHLMRSGRRYEHEIPWRDCR